jgi:glycosyltransferase involved in cell wall biosynthesis
MKELHRVIAATNPDVLYIWEITGIGINSLLSELRELTIPVIFHLGSYWLQYAQSPQTDHSHLHLRWFKKLLIGSVPSLTYTSLIAVSGTVKQEYAQVGCDPGQIEVIYNGIDSRFLDLPQTKKAGDSSAPKEVQLTYVGRLRIEKGVIVLLKALDVLLHKQERQDLHLNIFGDGDEVYTSELHAFVREKHLTQAVTFHGKIPQDELIWHYDHSDLLLVPSLWKEPFGLVVAEGMARGLPVIASNVGGPAEVITHNENGLLIEPGDEQALALAIAQLSEHPEERQRLSRAAKATVRERFTIEENARRVEQHLLRSYLNSKNLEDICVS